MALVLQQRRLRSVPKLQLKALEVLTLPASRPLRLLLAVQADSISLEVLQPQGRRVWGVGSTLEEVVVILPVDLRLVALGRILLVVPVIVLEEDLTLHQVCNYYYHDYRNM